MHLFRVWSAFDWIPHQSRLRAGRLFAQLQREYSTYLTPSVVYVGPLTSMFGTGGPSGCGLDHTNLATRQVRLTVRDELLYIRSWYGRHPHTQCCSHRRLLDCRRLHARVSCFGCCAVLVASIFFCILIKVPMRVLDNHIQSVFYTLKGSIHLLSFRCKSHEPALNMHQSLCRNIHWVQEELASAESYRCIVRESLQKDERQKGCESTAAAAGSFRHRARMGQAEF